MRVMRPRNRLVIFRLSEDEYRNLKMACSLREARSVSDFARDAVLGSIGTGERGEESRDRRLRELETGIRQILRLLERAADRVETRA